MAKLTLGGQVRMWQRLLGAHSATGNGSNPVQPVGSHWVRRNTSLTYCGTVFGIVHLPEV